MESYVIFFDYENLRISLAPIKYLFALTALDKYLADKNIELNQKFYDKRVCNESREEFADYLQTPSTKMEIVNYGTSSGEYPEFMKNVILFMLDQAIKNALDRIEATEKVLEENKFE